MNSLVNKITKQKTSLCLFFISFAIAYYVNANFIPNEDALILYRYAENFSETGIISYNLNSERTEGATDFLWMIILSIFVSFKFDIFFSAILINLLSLSILSIFLVKEYKLNFYYAFLIYLFHLTLGFTWSSIFGFSVLTVELILILFLIYFFKKKTFLSLLIGFIGCLMRPDFILFIFLVCLYDCIKKFSYQKFSTYFLFFILGILYFHWRYEYFGMLLPLPYYVKSQWELFHNLSWYKEITVLLPFTFFIIKYYKVIDLFSEKNILIIISLVIFPTLYYTNQVLYQNIGNRFYFYFIPVSLFLTFSIFSKHKNFNKSFLFIIVISSIISLTLNFYNKATFINTKHSARYLLPIELKNGPKNIKLASTEAGSIPYYSKLFTVDLFGLNTKELAKNPAGGKYLNNNMFDIVIITSGQFGTDCIGLNEFYKSSRKIIPKNKINRNSNWDQFTMQLMSGIDKENYTSFLIPIYSNKKDDNVFFFSNKNGNNFNFINKTLQKFGDECKL